MLQEVGARVDGAQQEDAGQGDDRGDVDKVHAAGDDDARHDGEDQKSQHVVHDRGTQNDMTLSGLGTAHLPQNPGGDPDARGGKRGADEHMGVGRCIGHQQIGRHIAQAKRQHHTDDGGPRRVGSNLAHLLDAALQPHQEQQKNHTVAGEDVHGVCHL